MLWVYRAYVQPPLTVGPLHVAAPCLPLLLCLPTRNSALLFQKDGNAQVGILLAGAGTAVPKANSGCRSL